MAIKTSISSWSTSRRDARARRREVRDAVRGEWELEPRPHGWAAVKAFVAQVGELEQARLAAHADAARRPPIPRPEESPSSTIADPAAAHRRAKRA